MCGEITHTNLYLGWVVSLDSLECSCNDASVHRIEHTFALTWDTRRRIVENRKPDMAVWVWVLE